MGEAGRDVAMHGGWPSTRRPRKCYATPKLPGDVRRCDLGHSLRPRWDIAAAACRFFRRRRASGRRTGRGHGRWGWPCGGGGGGVVTSPSEGQVQPTSQREDHHETGQHETRARPRRLVDVALAVLASHRVSGRGCERANDARGGRDQDGPAEHVRKAGELLAAFTAVVLHDHLEGHKQHAQDGDREADPARPGDDGVDVRAHTGRGGAVAAGPRQAVPGPPSGAGRQWYRPPKRYR